MIVLKLLITIFFWVYLQIVIFLVGLLSYPARLLPSQGRGFVYLLDRMVLKLLYLICFIRVKVTGLENLPKDGRIIFLANKPNLISTFALIAHFPRYLRFVANERMFHFAFLGHIIRAMGCIPAADGKERAMGFAAAILKALRNNEAVMFHPNNLRRGDGKVTPFKDVELKVAKMCDATVVPVVIKGSLEVMPQGSALISPGRIEITIGKPGLTIQDFAAFFQEKLNGN